MGPRAWIAILGLGVGGIFVFGFLTKFAIDSNPDLQAIIRFKAAFARDFEDRGVGDVSLKKSAKKRGHQILVTIPASAAQGGASGLDEEIAEYFVKNFEARGGMFLDIAYQAPARLGCEGPAMLRRAEVPLLPVKARLADREAAQRLSKRLEGERGCRLASFARVERELVVDVEVPAKPAGDPREDARKIEVIVRTELRAQPYASLRLRIHARPQAGATTPPLPFFEVRYDGAGKELGGAGEPRK